jgi:hypothetical protein
VDVITAVPATALLRFQNIKAVEGNKKLLTIKRIENNRKIPHVSGWCLISSLCRCPHTLITPKSGLQSGRIVSRGHSGAKSNRSRAVWS